MTKLTKLITLVIRGHIVLWISCLILLKSSEAIKFKRPAYCKELNAKENGSFLWEIKRDPPSYFFGTIHVPYTRVWDHIPENAKKAFAMSDRVYLELDLTDPFTISSLTSCQLLPRGASLSQVLPNELFIRLRTHLAYIKSKMPSWITADQKIRGLHADYLFNAITVNWKRKRPVWVMLMVNSLTKGDIRCRGEPVLDLFLTQEAEKQKKIVGAVEAVHEQCLPLNKLNYFQGVFALNHTLSQQESIRAGNSIPTHSTDSLIEYYNCGNLDSVLFAQDSTQASSLSVPHLSNGTLLPSEVSVAQSIDDYFREELIMQRNTRMGKRVADILRDHPDQSFFFAFGAGHFIGSNSILDVVRSAGIRVENVSPFEKIKRKKRKRGNKNGRLLPKPTILRNFNARTRVIQPDDEMDPTFAKFLSERQNRKSLQKDSSSYTTPRKPFNDLWVAIESQEQSITEVPSRTENKLLTEDSLRIWYGLPTSNAARTYDGHLFMNKIVPSILGYLIMTVNIIT